MTAGYRGPQVLEPLMQRMDWKFFHRVVSVSLTGQEFDDEKVAMMKQFRYLEDVTLYNTSTTDAAEEEFDATSPNVSFTIITPTSDVNLQALPASAVTRG